MDSFVFDEINSIKNLITMTKSKIRRHAVKKEFVLFVDSSLPGEYFSAAFALLSKGVDSVKLHIVLTDDHAKHFTDDFFSEICPEYGKNEQSFRDLMPRVQVYSSVEDFLKSGVQYTYKNIYACTFFNATDEKYANKAVSDKYFSDLSLIVKYFSALDADVSYLHYSVIPELKPLKGDLNSIAEREYEVYAAATHNTSAEKLVLQGEDVLRANFDGKLQMCAVRINNLFGPGIKNIYTDALLQQAQSGEFVLDTALSKKYIGLNYIRFAACAVFFMVHKGAKGNIYNLRQFSVTPFTMSLKAYNVLSEGEYGLKSVSSGESVSEYSLLCNKKVNALIPKKYLEMKCDECIYRTLIAKTGHEFTDRSLERKYDGKLDEIKKIEVEMIKEIKRICEKHNIKYFLVGGSLLGAVRHGGFIPWDDDLDIGMLRDDYEKFRKVAPDELPEAFFYQCPGTEPAAHYIFDKIRLKDTFFTTKFSDRFNIQNGLFIDILIYDKTSPVMKKQKMHITALRWMTRLISIRWVNKPRKGVAYKFSKIFLPFMRIFPLSFYHKIFDKLLTMYNKTSSHYLIDGVGMNIERGAFTDSWFDDVVEMPFEDIMLPVPVGYDEYLRHWYGDKYMELPPVSVRNSGHALRRVDLGRYLTNFGYPEGDYFKSDVKGELYDKK